MCHWEVSCFSRAKWHCSHAKQQQRNVQKKCAACANVCLLIRSDFDAILNAVAV